MVRSPADVFHLDPDALLELERWGAKSVDNLMRDLEERRHVPFDRYLVALAIPEVGTATAKLLARHFSTREELAAATAEELEELEGIGPEMARAITEWFASPESSALIERLAEGRVEIVYPDSDAAEASGELSGKVLVFTGSLEGLSRAEAKRLAEDAGARVASSVSAKTDFVVCGDKPGAKRKKAEALGVTILDEAAFLRLAGRAD